MAQAMPRDEQETIISYDKANDVWHFYSDVPEHIRKWQERVPSPTRNDVDELGINRVLEGDIDGSVQINRKRKLTPEQRKENAKRLAKYRNH